MSDQEAKLQALQVRLENTRMSLGRLKAERKNIDKKIARQVYRIKELEESISEMMPKEEGVSPEDIMLYLERNKGIDISEVKKEIMLSQAKGETL